MLTLARRLKDLAAGPRRYLVSRRATCHQIKRGNPRAPVIRPIRPRFVPWPFQTLRTYSAASRFGTACRDSIGGNDDST
jgi:hypothetical protein